MPEGTELILTGAAFNENTPVFIRLSFAFEFPEQHGDNCLLTTNFGFIDGAFHRLLA